MLHHYNGWRKKDIYIPVKVTAINPQHQEEVITLHDSQFDDVFGDELQQEHKDILSMMVFVKDRYSVSGAAYHEMAKVCREMPRHYRIKQKIAELNRT